MPLPFYEGDDPLKRVPRRALPVEGATLAPVIECLFLFMKGRLHELCSWRGRR